VSQNTVTYLGVCDYRRGFGLLDLLTLSLIPHFTDHCYTH
jgi:hypothetical protein